MLFFFVFWDDTRLYLCITKNMTICFGYISLFCKEKKGRISQEEVICEWREREGCLVDGTYNIIILHLSYFFISSQEAKQVQPL
jgi:hypothetical protein